MERETALQPRLVVTRTTAAGSRVIYDCRRAEQQDFRVSAVNVITYYITNLHGNVHELYYRVHEIIEREAITKASFLVFLDYDGAYTATTEWRPEGTYPDIDDSCE